MTSSSRVPRRMRRREDGPVLVRRGCKVQSTRRMPKRSSFQFQLYHQSLPVMLSKHFAPPFPSHISLKCLDCWSGPSEVCAALGSVLTHRSQRNVISVGVWGMWYPLTINSNEQNSHGGSLMSSLCENLSCSSFLSHLFDLSFRL